MSSGAVTYSWCFWPVILIALETASKAAKAKTVNFMLIFKIIINQHQNILINMCNFSIKKNGQAQDVENLFYFTDDALDSLGEIIKFTI